MSKELETQYFGESWQPPIDQAATPVGRLCFRCQRAIEDGDQGYLVPYIPAEGNRRAEPWHRVCLENEIVPGKGKK